MPGTLRVLICIISLNVIHINTQDIGIADGRNATLTFYHGISTSLIDYLTWTNGSGIYDLLYEFDEDGSTQVVQVYPLKFYGDFDSEITTLVIYDCGPEDVGIYEVELDYGRFFKPGRLYINFFVSDSEIGEIHTLLCGDEYQDVGSHIFITPCSTVNVVMPTGYSHHFTVEFSIDNGVIETLNDTDCDESDPCMLSFSLPQDYTLVHGSTFNVTVDLLLNSDPPVIPTFEFTYEDVAWGPWEGKCPTCGGCGTQQRSGTTSDGNVVYDTRQCPAKRCVIRTHRRREWAKPRHRWIVRPDVLLHVEMVA